MTTVFNSVESRSPELTIVWITPRPDRFPDEQAGRYGLHASPVLRSLVEYQHGTASGYWRGCHCVDCTIAERDYRRLWRQRRQVTKAGAP